MQEHQIYRNTHIDKTNALSMIEGIRKAVLGNKTDKEIFADETKCQK